MRAHKRDYRENVLSNNVARLRRNVWDTLKAMEGDEENQLELIRQLQKELAIFQHGISRYFDI